MRIVRLECVPLDLSLRQPYTIAYESVDTVHNVLVRLVTDTRHVGLGIAAPDEGVTGESPDSVMRALRDVAEPIVKGQDALRRAVMQHALLAALPNNPSVRAAIDMALHDLLGKVAGLPVYRLLGGFRDHIATSVTLYLTEAEQAVADAQALVADGFVALKVKGGRDVDRDVDLVRRVREAVGPQVELRFDANQGYDRSDCVRFWQGTMDHNVSVLEQPTPAAELSQLREVTQDVPLRVMADESILSLADAFRFAKGEAMDMVNLKLVKVGGIDKALLINGVARAAGLEVMVGCMDEAALSIAAGLAFALSRPNVEMADLDGHFDLIGDPTSTSVRLLAGHLYPSEEPGFGLVDIAV